MRRVAQYQPLALMRSKSVTNNEVFSSAVVTTALQKTSLFAREPLYSKGAVIAGWLQSKFQNISNNFVHPFFRKNTFLA